MVFWFTLFRWEYFVNFLQRSFPSITSLVSFLLSITQAWSYITSSFHLQASYAVGLILQLSLNFSPKFSNMSNYPYPNDPYNNPPPSSPKQPLHLSHTNSILVLTFLSLGIVLALLLGLVVGFQWGKRRMRQDTEMQNQRKKNSRDTTERQHGAGGQNGGQPDGASRTGGGHGTQGASGSGSGNNPGIQPSGGSQRAHGNPATNVSQHQAGNGTQS